MAVVCMAMAAAAGPADGQEPLAFQPREILAWQPHEFDGRTHYELGRKNGRAGVHARCEAGASGLFLRRKVDLRRTPIIEWRWLATRFPQGPRETEQAGDDFAARIYIVDEHALLPWRSRALNYVWSRAEPVGSHWANPFAAQARMVSLQTGAADGQWRLERRNIRADFQRYHGRDVERIDALAIMTDCDNTDTSAEAWYGEIHLRSE